MKPSFFLLDRSYNVTHGLCVLNATVSAGLGLMSTDILTFLLTLLTRDCCEFC